MDPLVSAGLKGAISGIPSLVSDFINLGIQNKNYQAQKEQLEYQKSAQQATWNREDSAVQRRVTDLRAAGLSPVLAAGSAAQTSAPIQVISPRRDNVSLQSPSMMFDKSQAILSMMTQRQNMETQILQQKQLLEQAKNTEMDTMLKNQMIRSSVLENQKIDPQLKKLEMENNTLWIKYLQDKWEYENNVNSLPSFFPNPARAASWIGMQDKNAKKEELNTLQPDLSKIMVGAMQGVVNPSDMPPVSRKRPSSKKLIER